MNRNRFLLILFVIALSAFVVACSPTVTEPEPTVGSEPTEPAAPTEATEPTAEATVPAEETPEPGVMDPTITGPLPMDATPIIGTPAVTGMEAVVESVEVQILESQPVQMQVVATGYLPDGCTNLDQVYQNNEGNSITVQLTTKRLIDALCTEAIVPFEHTIPLNLEGLAPGEYTVLVNGISQTFTLPG